jgi:GDP-4-dehydro-6-deoxy-D-mannose reductase
MTRRALVTGADGFVGPLLCDYLLQQGWEVRGCGLLAMPGADNQFVCDITDSVQLERLLDWCGPVTHVFHLAAITFVPESAQDPLRTFDVNVQGTIRLLHAARRRYPAVRFIYVGSSEVYGLPQSLPQTETHPLAPVNPYAISKAAADAYCAFLHRSEKADIVRMRPFNHSGPGQSERFVLSDFAKQIALIEAGKAEPVIAVGNLSAARDFTHVRDVVRAYALAALKGHAGEAYNVCSSRARTIQSALDGLLALSSASIRIQVEESRFRPVDAPTMCGSHAKLTEHTGWRPEIPFETLLEELLTFWRRQAGVAKTRDEAP